jgi:PRTRC genetic system ThiF family protein
MEIKRRYFCPDDWLHRVLDIALVGCGGTGGEVLDVLVRLDAAVQAMGHPGLRVMAIDPDFVEPHNCIRQRFLDPEDVGNPKSITLIHRANLTHGLTWDAELRRFEPGDADNVDLVIGATDSAAFRVALGEVARSSGRRCDRRQRLWLDFGNGATHGQCVIGHLAAPADIDWLPNVFDLYPALSTVRDDRSPSCSAIESLREQDLLVNSVLARMGMNLLWQLLTNGFIENHGCRIDVANLTASPLPIDPQSWAFFGYQQSAA